MAGFERETAGRCPRSPRQPTPPPRWTPWHRSPTRAAAAHGDDHTIKFTDTALDVGDATALAAALQSVELNPPAF